MRAFAAGESFELLITMTTAVGSAAVLFIGVIHVKSATLTLGELLLVMAYLGEFYGPLNSISRNVGKLQSHLAGAERVFGLLDETPDVRDAPSALSLTGARGAFELQNVSFAYDSNRKALRNVSLTIRSGSRVAIVGRSGAGKSTLVSLLARLYDPTEGRILLDGHDLRAYRVIDLRNQFAVVLQEPVLFAASLAENIAYARPDATRAEIVTAAEAAGAHQFISDLPAGYDTTVGDRGARLSGGERQRISLARAFLKNAPILILDEPTSSVDGLTEAEIVDALDALMVGKTTFVIAHRHSTLRRCDSVVELDAGGVRRFERIRSGDAHSVQSAGFRIAESPREAAS